MKSIVLSAGLVLAMAVPALADPVEGTWQTRPGDDGNFAHVEVESCGAAICGTLARAYNGEGQQIDSDNVGKRMVWDMKPQGGGAYGDGKIWAPDRDKVYDSRMELSGDTLTVKGCVLGGLICRGQDWKRVQ
ncbi:DUF2147 domain-containing protein [Maritimibacter sp. 55A14]|uniref:DUF2147 domain-containing protein n=1 Tax=Maritimibacter sp. 55A14 TaxID=2174844 RepID=UPI000D61E0AA|nr:DUF2147 domain-containing protein [Maritimibacter sp. 55A14]PWE30500.1 DUF2147 domain-containing protein [Maritimibacter sp. 55A14]